MACCGRTGTSPVVPDGEPALRAAAWAAHALPAPDAAVTIGSAHPIDLIASARNGRWLAACQARGDTDGDGRIWVKRGRHGGFQGDAMVPYLFRGGGAGRAIDALVAVSPDERWLVVHAEGHLLLIDDREGTERRIEDADRATDAVDLGRTASFDDTSKHLLYFRREGAASSLIIRELSAPRQREVSIPKAVLWRIEPEPAGPWARLRFVRDDTNHDGKLEWPGYDPAGVVSPACSPPGLGPANVGPMDDDVRTAWVNLETGQVNASPAVLAHVGSDEVVRAKDRAILVGGTKLVAASCDAKILAVSAHPRRVIATCARGTRESPVEMFGPAALRATLGVVQRPHADAIQIATLDGPYYCADPEGCFALEDGAQVKLQGRVARAIGAKLVVRQGEVYSVVDGRTGATTALRGMHGDPGAEAGDYVEIDGTVIDVARARVLGRVARDPLALDLRGRALVAAGDGLHGLRRGPYRWISTAEMHPAGAAVPLGTVAPERTIHGVALDEAGRPMPNVIVTLDQAQFNTYEDGSSTATATWTHPDLASPDNVVHTHQYRLPITTDQDGRFAWTLWQQAPGNPEARRTNAVMLVAGDGRVGSLDRIGPDNLTFAITLRRPGALRIVCHGVALGDPGVDVVAGVRHLRTDCDEIVGGLPAGAYDLLWKLDVLQYAFAHVEVRAGATTTAVLTPSAVGTIRGRVVAYPGGQPVAGMACRARVPFGETEAGGDPAATSAADGSFVLQAPRGPVHVWCESDRDETSTGIATVDLAATAAVTVRVVPYRDDAVDAGVAFDVEPDGARVASVRRRAARAGLVPGDLVLAVDGVSLAGLTYGGMQALAFECAPEAAVTWTVMRAGYTQTIRAAAW